MTFEKKFESVQKRFAAPDLTGINEKVAVQITLSDEDCGGILYAAYVDGAFEVAPYDYHDNTAALTIKATDLTRLLNGNLDVQKAAETGRIAVTGSLEHVALLAKIAGPAPKAPKAAKAAVEKAAPVVKAEVEKAAAAVKTEVEKAATAVKTTAEKAGPAVKKAAEKAGPAVKKAAEKAGPAVKAAADKAADKAAPAVKKAVEKAAAKKAAKKS